MSNIKVTNIYDGADHPVMDGSLFQVKVKPDTDLVIRGTLAEPRNSVGCVLAHHYYDAEGNATTWTHSAICMPSGNSWEAKIDKLQKGNYLLSLGDEKDLQTILLTVAPTGPGQIVPLLQVIDTVATAAKIAFTLSFQFLNNQVQFSLTPVNADGSARGPTVFHNERPNVSPWTTTFLPAEWGIAAFSGFYKFTANSYEGSTTKTVQV